MTAVQHDAPPNYALDLEVYPVAELRRRVDELARLQLAQEQRTHLRLCTAARQARRG